MEYNFFKAFDYLDASLDLPQRAATVVAPQALYVMNSPLVMEMAEGFAQSIRQRDISDEQRVHLAFEKAYNRPPSATELSQALSFINHETLDSDTEQDTDSWTNLCHVMLASSEFLYIN